MERRNRFVYAIGFGPYIELRISSKPPKPIVCRFTTGRFVKKGTWIPPQNLNDYGGHYAKEDETIPVVLKSVSYEGGLLLDYVPSFKFHRTFKRTVLRDKMIKMSEADSIKLCNPAVRRRLKELPKRGRRI